jgi:hypothetical protein
VLEGEKMVSNVRASIGVGLLLGLTLSLLMWVSASPAQAETVTDCQAKIADLRASTLAAQTFTNGKDQVGLVGKLDSASAKLTQGKTADAINNLTSFRDKVSTLGVQGKLGEEEANTLITGADDAIACITAPETQTPTAA